MFYELSIYKKLIQLIRIVFKYGFNPSKFFDEYDKFEEQRKLDFRLGHYAFVFWASSFMVATFVIGVDSRKPLEKIIPLLLIEILGATLTLGEISFQNFVHKKYPNRNSKRAISHNSFITALIVIGLMLSTFVILNE